MYVRKTAWPASDLDLLVSRGYGIQVLKNDGSAKFTLETTYFSGSGGAADLVPADMDGNGDLDVVIDASSRITVLENRPR